MSRSCSAARSRRRPSRRLRHRDAGKRDAVRQRDLELLERLEAVGAVERHAGQRRHQHEPREAFAPSGVLALLEDPPARDRAASSRRRTNIARTRAGSVVGSSSRTSPSASPLPACSRSRRLQPPHATASRPLSSTKYVPSVSRIGSTSGDVAHRARRLRARRRSAGRAPRRMTFMSSSSARSSAGVARRRLGCPSTTRRA